MIILIRHYIMVTISHYCNLDIGNFEAIFNNDVDLSLRSSANGLGFRHPNLDTYLAITHAPVIAEYEKELHDYHDIPCQRV